MTRSRIISAFDKLRKTPLFGRPVLCAVVAFIVGIAAAVHVQVSLLTWLIMGLVGVVLLTINALWFGKTIHFTLILLIAFALGAFVCTGQKTALDAWDIPDGANVDVTGKVEALSHREEGWRARLQVHTVNGIEKDCADIYLYGDGPMPEGGSIIRGKGQVFQPQPYGNTNAFDYGEYMRQQGIAGSVSTMYTGEVTLVKEAPAFWLGDISLWMKENLDKAASWLTQQQKTLIYGIFLGDKSGMDYEMKNALGLSGALHAFAVSGLHVGYITLMAAILGGIKHRYRYPRFILCAFMLLLYIGMTGGTASVLRASLMSMIVLLIFVINDEEDMTTVLAIAALLCLLWQPLWLFSAGFQLSFAAAIGIIAFMPMFDRMLENLPWSIRSFFAVTLAATISTLPLICYYFYHISWWGWLLSPLVILAAGVVVIMSFIATVIAIFSPWLAGIFLQAAAYAAEPVYLLCATISDNSAQITGAISVLPMLLFYAGAIVVMTFHEKLPRTVVALLIAAIMFAFSFVPLKEKESALTGQVTEIVFVDVGQGDCALVITPDEKTMLIDGGGDMWNPGDVAQYSLLPYLKSRSIERIDVVMNSHPDEDHADGLLGVFEHLEVGELVIADMWQGEGLSDQLKAAAIADGAEIRDMRAGDSMMLGEFVEIACYYPYPGIDALPYGENTNNYSLTVELSCGDIDILFSGDIDGDKLAQICEEYEVEAEIIKIPHHGSNTGYYYELADILCTQAAVISVGKDNSYGHPTAKVVEYWQANGAVYRTDTDGSVTIYTNGKDYEVSVYY